MKDYEYFIPGYTGFCPELPLHFGHRYGLATRHVIRHHPHIRERLSPIYYKNQQTNGHQQCHCGEMTHYAQQPVRQCGKKTHYAQQPVRQCGKMTHYAQQPVSHSGKLAHYAQMKPPDSHCDKMAHYAHQQLPDIYTHQQLPDIYTHQQLPGSHCDNQDHYIRQLPSSHSSKSGHSEQKPVPDSHYEELRSSGDGSVTRSYWEDRDQICSIYAICVPKNEIHRKGKDSTRCRPRECPVGPIHCPLLQSKGKVQHCPAEYCREDYRSRRVPRVKPHRRGGVVPNYTGHITGIKFSFGESYGPASDRLLQRHHDYMTEYHRKL